MTPSPGLEALPPLRDVIAGLGLSARKSMGQNFLLDLNLTRRIARAGGPLDGAHIIEIGPGPGGLTRALLLEGAARVTVIERDERVRPALEDIAAAAPGRLEVIMGDALAFDMSSLANTAPARIVANLPYNIGSALLVRWLTETRWPPFWESLTLMFQREVAKRIVAKVGETAYGRLAVLAGWRTDARLLFSVPPQAFTPRPKVTSALVRIEPDRDADPASPEMVGAVTAAAFGQRRKMVRTSLGSVIGDTDLVLAQLGIDPRLRAEQLAITDYLALARYAESHPVSVG